MHNIPDMIGMKMPAAAKLFEAAGVSYDTEILKPVKPAAEPGTLRIIRQVRTGENSVRLSLCEVYEP
ncbi:MAG: hypothetical protein HFE90_02500 [Firmicutes bacterium]|nr:hypothetical protein [Bacillota bacterium]